MDKDLISAYKQMRSAVEQGLEEAAQQGKKILIVAGENHNNRSSLLLEAMLLYILKDLGIKNLLVEGSPDELKSLESSIQAVNRINSSPVDCCGFFKNSRREWLQEFDGAQNSIYLLTLAHKLKIKVNPTDIENKMDHNFYDTTKRDSAMGENCLKIEEHAAFIVGSAHMKGAMQNKGLQEKFHILSMNLNNQRPDEPITSIEWNGEWREMPHAKEKNDVYKKIIFSFSEENALQFNLPDNIPQLQEGSDRDAILQLAKDIHENAVTEELESQESEESDFIVRMD